MVQQITLDAREAVRPLMWPFTPEDRQEHGEEELDMWHDESFGLIFLKYWHPKMVKGGFEASLADCSRPWITLKEFSDGSYKQKAIERREELVSRCRKMVAQYLAAETCA